MSGAMSFHTLVHSDFFLNIFENCAQISENKASHLKWITGDNEHKSKYWEVSEQIKLKDIRNADSNALGSARMEYPTNFWTQNEVPHQ